MCGPDKRWLNFSSDLERVLATLQVLRRGTSKSSWQPVSRWTSVFVSSPAGGAANTDGRHQYTLDGLAVGVHYQLDVRAVNELDTSPPLRPSFVFYTHPGRYIALHRLPSLSLAGVVPNMSHCQITRSTRFAREVGIIKPNPSLTLTQEINHLRTVRDCEIAHAQWRGCELFDATPG